MSARRALPGLAGLLLVVAVAAGGAAANLRLLAPRQVASTPVGQAPEPGAGSRPTTTTSLGAADTTPGSTVPTTATTSTTTTRPASSATTSTTRAEGVPRTYVVGEAGSVTLRVEAGRIVVDGVARHPGWTHTVEGRADEVEVHFRRSSPEGEAELHARLADGALRVEIEAGEGDAPDD